MSTEEKLLTGNYFSERPAEFQLYDSRYVRIFDTSAISHSGLRIVVYNMLIPTSYHQNQFLQVTAWPARSTLGHGHHSERHGKGSPNFSPRRSS